MTKREAAWKWVHEFNAIPISVVEKLMKVSDYTDIVEVLLPEEDFEFDTLPMWETMWQMTDITDVDWFESHIADIKKCGFRVYESEDFGYLIGIDGAGYDFYEAHWIPLYEVRGLKWHDKEEG